MAQVRDGKFASLKTRLLWTALFFLCFMIGRYIPIPLLQGELSGGGTELLNAANIATGGDYFSPSLFSLGLGPWMGAAILWRLLLIGKLASGRRIPERTVTRARNALIVFLALVQSVALLSRYDVAGLAWGPFAPQVNAQIAVVAILTAGALAVAWLAQRNDELGLGGVTMFILYQLIITMTRNAEPLGAAWTDPGNGPVLAFVAVACVGVILLGVFAGNAEVRLHVNRTSIDNGYIGVSYLPVKLNPAGAAPIMYALALLTIPSAVVRAVGFLVPGIAEGTDTFLAAWSLGSPLGFMAYLLLLFGLTIFFGLFTVDPRGVAKRMRERGEYFDRIAPGGATARHLRGRVVALAMLSGAFLVVFTGLPLMFMGSHPHLQFLLMLPGTLMILLGLLWMLYEEIADALIGTRYDFVFGARTGGASA